MLFARHTTASSATVGLQSQLLAGRGSHSCKMCMNCNHFKTCPLDQAGDRAHAPATRGRTAPSLQQHGLAGGVFQLVTLFGVCTGVPQVQLAPVGA